MIINVPDLIIAICIAALAMGLYPTIRGHQKPPRLMALVYTLSLWIMAATFLHMTLVLSTILVSAQATGWSIVLYQVRKKDRG